MLLLLQVKRQSMDRKLTALTVNKKSQAQLSIEKDMRNGKPLSMLRALKPALLEPQWAVFRLQRGYVYHLAPKGYRFREMLMVSDAFWGTLDPPKKSSSHTHPVGGRTRNNNEDYVDSLLGLDRPIISDFP